MRKQNRETTVELMFAFHATQTRSIAASVNILCFLEHEMYCNSFYRRLTILLHTLIWTASHYVRILYFSFSSISGYV